MHVSVGHGPSSRYAFVEPHVQPIRCKVLKEISTHVVDQPPHGCSDFGLQVEQLGFVMPRNYEGMTRPDGERIIERHGMLVGPAIVA